MVRTKVLDWLLVTLLILAAGAVLGPLLDCEFFTDDFYVVRFITYGPETGVRFDPDDSLEVLRYFLIRSTERYELYRPLVALSLRVSYDLHGLEPFALDNLLIHLLGGLTTFFLARRAFPEGARTMALLGTAFFLLHPLQVQVPAWSAARADSLAWVIGSSALLLRLRRPDALLGPGLALALCLFTKESALAFAAALVLIELASPGAPERAFGRRLVRSLPAIAITLGFLLLRSRVMGGEIGSSSYGGRVAGDILSQEGLDNLLSALVTAFGSTSSLFVDERWLLLTLQVVFALLQILLLGLAIRAAGRGQARVLPALIALLVLPFLMAALVSRLDDRFHNARGCYLSLAAVGVLVAALRPTRRNLALGLLLLAGLLPMSRLVADYYRFATRSSAAMTAELRSAIAPFADGRHEELALLNFQEEAWFRGGFNIFGAMDPALTRPFTKQDWRLRKVRARRTVVNHPSLVELAELFDRPREDLVLVKMSIHSDQSRQTFARLYPPAPTAGAASAVTILAPTNGARLVLDAARPDSLVPRYRLRHPYGAAVRHRVMLFNRNGPTVDTVIEPTAVIEDREGPEYLLELPALPPEMLRDPDLPGTVAMGICIEDAEGRQIDVSPLIAVEVEVRP
ncbi:MAG: hypothetical protein H6807_11570 [Planctomycetes bacterium]|nr:hypothetical protein [Planctomycetota bacterium]